MLFFIQGEIDSREFDMTYLHARLKSFLLRIKDSFHQRILRRKVEN